MATRNIKDAKDLSTNELIYFKGHAQATFMSDGRTVEEAINDIDTSGSTPDLSNVVQYNENGQAVIQNGTIYDGNSGILYALPSASAEDKGEADYVIATEDYVDSKVSSETIVTENSTAPAFLSTGQIKNNEVYILTSDISSLTINNLAFSEHTKDYEKFTMIFTTASSASFNGVSFPADWKWANGVAPNVEKGVTYELSVAYYARFSSSVRYNAILTPFKAV